MALIGPWARSFNPVQALPKQVKLLAGQLMISGSGVISGSGLGVGFSGSLTSTASAAGQNGASGIYRITIGNSITFSNTGSGFTPAVVPGVVSAVGNWFGTNPVNVGINAVSVAQAGTGSYVEYKLTGVASGSTIGSGSLHFSIAVHNSSV